MIDESGDQQLTLLQTSMHNDNTQSTPAAKRPGGATPPGVSYHKLIEEQQVQDYGAGSRGAHITLLCLTSCFTLCMVIAAMATNVYTKTTTYWTIGQSMWYSELCWQGTCTSSNLPNGACEAENARIRSIMAFVILTFLSTILAMAVSASDMVQRCPHERLPIITFTVSTFFTMMTWALIAGTYHAAPCSGNLSLSHQGYKMSVSFSLLLSLWLIQIFMLTFYFVKRFLGSYQRRAINEWLGRPEGGDEHTMHSSRSGAGSPRDGRAGNRSGRYHGSPSASRRDGGLEEEGYHSAPPSTNDRRSRSGTSVGANLSTMRDAVMGKQEMQSTVHHDHTL